ncbi:polysaccharide deacetylase family protein [uncultured Ilyobacter sp.]|uniref:polysaccharide deacetylase family protein n=1 Tax=uncultured Ilyobacter sp. TaxID=544433 RepID=UPI0029C71CA7|nr:polysaccharide deacetylase family protein [uncultured Ilyobacter sp.]
MNILMALSQLEVTGAEVYAATLSDRLIKKGHKVFIVSDTFTKETNGEFHKLEFNKRNLLKRISQVKFLVDFIKKNDIQVAHAHSRASSWSTSIACTMTGIPLITTVHGRQPVHLSRKIFKAFGDYSFAVCENIRDHLIKDLGVKEDRIEILRNGIDINSYIETPLPKNEKKVVSIIGRLSGPKGEVTYNLLEKALNSDLYHVRIIGGKNIPDKFKKFTDKVDFFGYVNNIPEFIKKSDLVIGAGRVAVEAILSGRPVLAIGEAKSIGLITKDNIAEALSSNFGDIGVMLEEGFDWDKMLEDVREAFELNENELHEIRHKVKKEFDLKKIVRNLEIAYQKQIVLKKKYEMPILMYHRVIKEDSEKGVHGTYVTSEQFDEHMNILKNMGYETVVFKDLLKNRFKQRFDKNKKQIMITFDDGYEDNYKYAFPILKKYEFKAVVYLVSHLDYNKWDVENISNPEKKYNLMPKEHLLEMQKYGIEFGGHTKTHVKLSRIEPEEARDEIFESKETLENLLNQKLISFAYPYGDLNDRVKKIAEEAGYKFAVSTDSGSVCFSDDLFQIRRIGIFPTITSLGFKRKIKGNYNFIKIRREQKNER